MLIAFEKYVFVELLTSQNGAKLAITRTSTWHYHFEVRRLEIASLRGLRSCGVGDMKVAQRVHLHSARSPAGGGGKRESRNGSSPD